MMCLLWVNATTTMLDYLLRRDATGANTSNTNPGTDGDSAMRDDAAKLSALTQAESLAGDEAGAVDFITQCRFADARLRAAEHIHTRSFLEQIQQAMRKVDRRVAKLAQDRIDAIVKSELVAKHAQECIAVAKSLLQEVQLMPNLVADMDRSWRSIGVVAEPERSIFSSLRTELDARLSAQTSLQRSVIDALGALRKIKAEQAWETTDVAEVLDRFSEQVQVFKSAAEASSLPRNLLADFESEIRSLSDKKAVLEKPKISEIESVPSSDNNSAQVILPQAPIPPKGREAPPPAFFEALDAMTQAVQDGALHLALEQDENIKTMNLSRFRVKESDGARLASVRADLKRMQGWARWGGNVSRDALIKSVEGMPAQKLPLKDLSKLVSGARDQWKALDAASGAAPKTLWQRFDAACSTAYAPVAEHARKQAQQRQQNRSIADEIIEKISQFADASGLMVQAPDAATMDWKLLANFYRASLQSWQSLGYMDRKEKKSFDAKFEKVIRLLREPLKAQWKLEAERREAMIAEVESIIPEDRKAIDHVQTLQKRWQTAAKAMPLERRIEQALWERFRKACNGVFDKRKQNNQSADAERVKNAEVKEALIVGLERAVNENEASIRKLLRGADAACKKIGPVPRARERQIETRYQKAVAALQARLNTVKIAEAKMQHDALLEKLVLCQAVESALRSNLANDPAWVSRWESLPSVRSTREGAMRKRFDAAVNALTTSDRAYAELLERNTSSLYQELLRAEILAGVESPPEHAQDRMRVQLEVLQASLSGDKDVSYGERIERLLALPAYADDQSIARLSRLLKK